MRRRPIQYELIAGDVRSVKHEVAWLVSDGWRLYGGLIRLNDTQVARELVKYEPIQHAADGGVTLTVGED